MPTPPASVLTWGLLPRPCSSVSKQTRRGPGIGPGMPRDGKIFIKLDAHVLEAQPWGADQCGNSTLLCSPGSSICHGSVMSVPWHPQARGRALL